MKSVAQATRRIGWCGCVLAASLWLSVARSQVADSPQVVYMVINAPASETREEIEDKFGLARKNTGGNFNCNGILVEPIKAEMFGLLNSIVTRGAEAVRGGQKEERQIIERLAARPNAWIVDLGNAALIESATVDVVRADGSGEESLKWESGAVPTDGFQVALHSGGRYVVSLPQGVRPLRFRCQPIDLDGGAQPDSPELTADFPPPDSGLAYLVTLNGVKGDAKFLFDALKDGTKVNNPIREMSEVPLIVANFDPNRASFNTISGGEVALRFSVPKGESPARLWLFFAATKAACDTEKRRVTAEDFQGIPRLVREKLSQAIKPGGDGGWVELSPARGDWFEGKIRVDVPAWQAALQADAADANDQLLLVYEGDFGGESRAIKIESEYVVTETLPWWLPAIRAAK